MKTTKRNSGGGRASRSAARDLVTYATCCLRLKIPLRSAQAFNSIRLLVAAARSGRA